MYAMAKLAELPTYIDYSIRLINTTKPDTYLSWRTPVQNHLDRWNTEYNISELNKACSPQVMSLLEVCEDRIDEHCRDPRPGQDDIAKIKKLYENIWSLIEEVSCGKMDSVLKRYCLDQLGAIERACVDFMVCGVKRTKGAPYQILGSAAVQPELTSRLRDSDLGQRVIKSTYAFITVIALAQGAEYLLDKATDVGLLPAQGEVEPKLIENVMSDVPGKPGNL